MTNVFTIEGVASSLLHDEMMRRAGEVIVERQRRRAHYYAIVPKSPVTADYLPRRYPWPLGSQSLGHFAPGIRRQIDFRMSASFIFSRAPCVLENSSLYATRAPPPAPQIGRWKLLLSKVLFLGSEKVSTNSPRRRFFVRWEYKLGVQSPLPLPHVLRPEDLL